MYIARPLRLPARLAVSQGLLSPQVTFRRCASSTDLGVTTRQQVKVAWSRDQPRLLTGDNTARLKNFRQIARVQELR
jgi:hypothetical protein